MITTYKNFLYEKSESDYNKDFPIINGKYVGDLFIRDEIPNMSSISSSLYDYEILNGIREVSFSKSFPEYEPSYYSLSDKQKTQRLSEEIKENKEINPLIVVVDKDGPYILEGSHRFDALKELGIDLFPAKVVLDLESLNESKLFEFQKQDINLLESMDDYFTIGFEIEIESDFDQNRNIRVGESKVLYMSRKESKKVANFERNFINFIREFGTNITYHYDETLVDGLEIVNKQPFTSIRKAKNYINLFFDDFEQQSDWIFNHKTSIHVNIGVKKKKWNIVKGVIMISDDYSIKNIEFRKYSGFCNSIKNEIFDLWVRKLKHNYLNSELDDNNIKQIEKEFETNILSLTRNMPKHYGINFSNLEKKNYIEFRFIGESDTYYSDWKKVNQKLVIDKMMYFLYIVYLMTSNYKQKDYYHKLMNFVTKIKTKSTEDIDSFKSMVKTLLRPRRPDVLSNLNSKIKSQYRSKPNIP